MDRKRKNKNPEDGYRLMVAIPIFSPFQYVRLVRKVKTEDVFRKKYLYNKSSKMNQNSLKHL